MLKDKQYTGHKVNLILETSIKAFVRSLFCGICIVTLLASCSPSDSGSATPELSVLSVNELDPVLQDSDLLGRDGGYSVMRQGVSTWVFGDGFFTVPNAEGETFLSNSWSQTVDLDASDGIDLGRAQRDDSNRPVELFRYTDEELQFNRVHRGTDCVEQPCQQRYALWPGAIVDDPMRQRSILFYTKLRAAPGAFNFSNIGQSIAVWPYSSNQPQRVLTNANLSDPTILFPSSEPHWGNAAIVIDEYLYAFACMRVRTVKPCKLARVELANVESVSDWEYLSESGENPLWSNQSIQAVDIFNGNDILSIFYNDYFNRYMAIYSRPISKTIEMRTAKQVTGPWTSATTITTAVPGSNANEWVYDALAHPEFAEQNGKVQYLTYTSGTALFSSDFRLVKVEFEN